MGLSGIDDFSNLLDDLDRKARELDGKHKVPIEEILTPDFVSSCSKYASIDSFLKQVDLALSRRKNSNMFRMKSLTLTCRPQQSLEAGTKC